MMNLKIFGKLDNIIKLIFFVRIENLCCCFCFICILEFIFVLIEKWLYFFI